jgi:predicted enzyme related to lactoylglutathione lyase
MGKKNPVQHVEWRTKDRDRLMKFYGAIFSWKFKEEMGGQYTMVDFGNKDGGGGIFPVGTMPIPTGIVNYATVDSVDETEQKVKAAGGQVHGPKQEIPDVGWFLTFSDPDGNTFAAWQQAPTPKQAKKAAKKAKKAEKKAAKKAKKATKATKAK